MLALGTLSGAVSLRNQNGEELHRIERKAPVKCLLFLEDFSTVSAESMGQSLIVASMDKILSYYL
jgi:hypothetical protein